MLFVFWQRHVEAAELSVVAIHSETTVVVATSSESPPQNKQDDVIPRTTPVKIHKRSVSLKKDDILAFFSDDDSITGYGIILSTKSNRALVKVSVHAQNKLIIIGNRAIKIDPTRRDHNYKGRVDLLLKKRPGLSSRYKMLASPGLLVGDGQALERGEMLFEPFGNVQVGITDRLTVFATPFVILNNHYRAGVKMSLLDNPIFNLTGELLGGFVKENKVFYATVGAVLTIYSNGKFISYLEGAATVANAEFSIQNDDEDKSFAEKYRTHGFDTYIRGRTEYIFDNWNRLLFGPTYDFTHSSVGGFLGYMFIGEEFHLGVGVQTTDFLNMKIDIEDGYFPWVTAMWRFRIFK